MCWIDFGDPIQASLFQLFVDIAIKFNQPNGPFQMAYFSRLGDPIEIDCLQFDIFNGSEWK